MVFLFPGFGLFFLYCLYCGRFSFRAYPCIQSQQARPYRITPLRINDFRMNNNTFDAIVIGSGISGGWAAKELCEKGLKTLVLERGRNVRHKEDYPTMHTPPWEFPLRGQLSLKVKQENPIVSRCYAFKDDADHFL